MLALAIILHVVIFAGFAGFAVKAIVDSIRDRRERIAFEAAWRARPTTPDFLEAERIARLRALNA